ncbi:MAG: hypothetical protein WBB69_06630 [Anaerolineales bacterium]
MTKSSENQFIELSDHWLSITRKDFLTRGFGKWILGSADPQRLYQILREELTAGALREAFSVKTKAKLPKGTKTGAVYVHTAPYPDRGKILRLAEELGELDVVHEFRLDRPLVFTTDLHNTWEFTLSRPGDGYHELLKAHNWIYKYSDGELVVNPAIQALHQAMENPPENADPEFLIIRSMLPEELFAGNKNVGSK